MKIWIDADAAPKDVKEIVYRAAQRLSLSVVLVANRRLVTPLNNESITAVRVDGGPDVADRYIIDNSQRGDLAVTADVPLAAELVAKGVVVLDTRGALLDEENVRERLSVRDFMESLRGAGVETGGAAPWSMRDRQAFAAGLDRILAKLARR